jgi:hypothetical protein
VRYPAAELAEQHAQRGEHELYYRELKLDVRSSSVLISHTLETALQELAALGLSHVRTVVADRLDRAALSCLFGEGNFFGGDRLALHEGESGLVVTPENDRGRFAAEVAIDALGIDVPAAGNVLREAVSGNCHGGVG